MPVGFGLTAQPSSPGPLLIRIAIEIKTAEATRSEKPSPAMLTADAHAGIASTLPNVPPQSCRGLVPLAGSWHRIALGAGWLSSADARSASEKAALGKFWRARARSSHPKNCAP